VGDPRGSRRRRRGREEDFPPPLLGSDPGADDRSARATGPGDVADPAPYRDTGTRRLRSGSRRDADSRDRAGADQFQDTGGHIPAHARGWDTSTGNIPPQDPAPRGYDRRDAGSRSPYGAADPSLTNRGEGWVRLDAPGDPQDLQDPQDHRDDPGRGYPVSPADRLPPGDPPPASDRHRNGDAADDGPSRGRPRGRRRVIVPLLLIVLVGWTATAVFPVSGPAPLASLLAVLAMGVPLVTLIVIPVLGIALLRRRWSLAVVTVLVAVGPWLLVFSSLSSADPAARNARTVRVLVVNARAGAADANRIVDETHTQNADVLVITGLSPTLAHDLTTDGINTTLTPVSVLTPSPATAGIGVYSRLPASDVEQLHTTHWPAVRAKLSLGKGTFTFVAVNVPPPTPSRVTTWESDLAGVREAANVAGTVAVAGTLNATAWNPQLRAVTSGRLYDVTAVLGKGLRPTWPSWLPIPVVSTEHVLVTGNVGVTQVETAPVTGSDHRCILAALRVPQD
jgi:endonuclease/exonuclease/phosphatase (EEP) superfamily protein YafD